MTPIHALILGIVEGLTEFLPISSTAHLILTSKILGISQSKFTTFFEVFIQSGAILAIVLLYYRYIIDHKKLILFLIISFIPTAIVGLVLHDTIKTIFFHSTIIIAFSLFSIGVVFIMTEILVENGQLNLIKNIDNMSYKEAFFIGCFQALSVIPGVSRAGAVIVGSMILGYKRKDSAIYSFLVSIPTIFAASAFDLVKTDLSLIKHGSNSLLIGTGFITSFITALIVVKWLIRYLQKNSLVIFGVYRIILALLLFVIMFFTPIAYSQEIITADKLITVDIGKQKLFAWEGGKIVFETKVSTGMRKAPTVKGSFKIRRKVLVQDMRGNDKFYGPYYIKSVPHVMYFHQGYAIHGTYWHNKFGYRASHGCVNVPTSAAEWLYNWTPQNTRIEVF